ncbi:MAG: TetR family transcriptional regulator C-terminal domain-containing protein [Oscillospiraceae bacterium]|nr:TetR family transcriptional regulator C-terminal domain-containing protein [Oscillospiraceae bacterium]
MRFKSQLEGADARDEIQDYQNAFFGAAVNRILLKWFLDGAKRTPEEMADIFFTHEGQGILVGFCDKERIRQTLTKKVDVNEETGL